jgi:AcrR family transcriptional regulator
MAARKEDHRPAVERRTGAPTRQQAARLRQRLMVERVAERLFASRGYRGTSLRLVAAKAGCSVGQLYNLHRNKDELYRAIWEKKIGHLTELALQARNGNGPVTVRLRDLLQAVLVFFQQNTAFFQIYSSETDLRFGSSQRSFLEMVARHHGLLLAHMEELLREGQRRGEFRSDFDCAETAVTVMGMVRSHTVEWCWHAHKGSLVDRAEGIIALFLHGVGRRGGDS